MEPGKGSNTKEGKLAQTKIKAIQTDIATSTTTMTNKTLTSPVIDGAGGTGAGVLGYGATDHNLLVGNGTSNLPIHVYHWKAFTPTWSNITEGTGATKSGAYCQIGKVIHFWAKLTLGTSGSLTGVPVLTLPVAIGSTDIRIVGSCMYVDTGTQNYIGYVDGYGYMRLHAVVGTYLTLNNINATVPFTWTATDAIYVQGTYEAA